LNVGEFHFEQKAEKRHFCQRLHPDQIPNNAQNIDWVDLSQKFHSPIAHPASTFHSVKLVLIYMLVNMFS